MQSLRIAERRFRSTTHTVHFQISAKTKCYVSRLFPFRAPAKSQQTVVWNIKYALYVQQTMLFVHRVAKTIRLLADNVLRALYEKTFWNLLLPLLRNSITMITLITFQIDLKMSVHRTTRHLTRTREQDAIERGKMREDREVKFVYSRLELLTIRENLVRKFIKYNWTWPISLIGLDRNK